MCNNNMHTHNTTEIGSIRRTSTPNTFVRRPMQ